MIEPSIVPTPELIRYLCLFHRAFDVMRRFVQEQDEDGVVLMAWIADAIHNLPAMLWQHDGIPSEQAEQTKIWVNNFPQVVRDCSPPDYITVACDAIFSTRDTAADVGLADDMHDLDLAPPDKLAVYIDLFYYVCLAIRWRQRPRTPWRARDRFWAERQLSTTQMMGDLANVLVSVPVGLTHWRQFDEEAFAKKVRSFWNEWPTGFGIERLQRYKKETGM